MSDYVNAIINVCGKHDIPVINLFTVPELDPRDPQLKAKYFIDDEHPTHLGHDIIASKLIALIKKL
jgi:lysophospholipase L1-like esterase